MRKSLIYVGAGLLAIASSIGIENKLDLIRNAYETRQNIPQVVRVLELEDELFKLTGGMKGSEALEKYVNDAQFRDSYNSLTNKYNSLISQPNIRDAVSSDKRDNFYAGFNGMLFGAGIMSTVLGLTSLVFGLRNKRKKNYEEKRK